jgi:hypothetical protein
MHFTDPAYFPAVRSGISRIAENTVDETSREDWESAALEVIERWQTADIDESPLSFDDIARVRTSSFASYWILECSGNSLLLIMQMRFFWHHVEGSEVWEQAKGETRLRGLELTDALAVLGLRDTPEVPNKQAKSKSKGKDKRKHEDVPDALPTPAAVEKAVAEHAMFCFPKYDDDKFGSTPQLKEFILMRVLKGVILNPELRCVRACWARETLDFYFSPAKLKSKVWS